jgi:hypothetical protein
MGSLALLFGLAVSRAFGHGRPLVARERIPS